jgi:hypothetical protein
MSVLTDIATHMVDNGFGTLNTNMSRGRLHDEADELTVIQTYLSQMPRIRNNEYLAADERFNIQVLTRANYQAAAETRALNAYNAIQFRNETLDSGRYYPYCRAIQMPAYLDVDDRGRHLVVFNVEVRRLRSTGL